jgi:branched-chain amino acid transport system permease protein
VSSVQDTPPTADPGGSTPPEPGRSLSGGWSEVQAQVREWRQAVDNFLPFWWRRAVTFTLVMLAILLPFIFSEASNFMDATIKSVALAVMALGLNIVVGFAGLLDLGYVAFYAIGSYCAGWFGSGFFFKANVHVGVYTPHIASGLPTVGGGAGIHLNFAIIMILAAAICALAGIIIGLPTLRLRGDYIAIVTLAFGEIIAVVAVNGQDIHIGGGMSLTAGDFGISAIDSPYFGLGGSFSQLNLRPWYWLILGVLFISLFICVRLRDSRLGRAWVALREDEVAAVSMGIPAVRTKLMAYAIGATFGGVSGAFLGSYFTVVTGDNFQFGFSVLILSMIIIGGLGSISGALVGGLLLGYVNYWLLPNVLNNLPGKLGLNFQLATVEFGVYGFLLVLMMIVRPQGLVPERRRKLELTAQVAALDSELAESPASQVPN